MTIVGTYEIAERLGVKPATVHKWRQRNLGFPPPHVTLRVGPIWDWHEVEQWAATRLL